ncbi:DUF2505 domain-containing protein [Tessaracoccus sp. OS52]|uniref:DUF2505 domain-containing protein n=1 Tax=Tessaracoccus sp. OS52 TaxID=2886691 RepID=UPI001D12DC65|nr:DUF2505 domain-containing protein [Tessaracoccus sp. OS52]MCC2592797.1 DUF2505 domain-containing protein [Tessaracoccus sp. OS52]
MQLTYHHTYNGTPEQVVALMRNKDFIADVAKHAGATSHEVTVEGTVVTLRMSLPVPGEVARFVGKDVNMVQRFEWGSPQADGTSRGNVDVDVKGMPINVAAVAVLKPLGEATAGDYSGDLNVKLPLVGGKVEKMVAPFIEKAFAGIERRAQEWLARDQQG